MGNSERDRKLIDQEVQKTLKSLDSTNDIKADPYFYTRLKARIDSSEQKRISWFAKFLLSSPLAPSLLVAVILLNILSAAVTLRDSNESQNELRQQYVEAVADEYLFTNTFNLLDTIVE